MRTVGLFLTWFSLVFAVQAIARPVATITGSNSSITIAKNTSTTMTLTFSNSSGASLTPTSTNLESNSSLTTNSITTNNCLNSAVNSGSSCTMTVQIAAGSTTGSSTMSARVCEFGGGMCQTMTAPVNISVLNAVNLVFKQDSSEVSSISTVGGNADSFTVENVGSSTITNFSLSIPSELSDYVTGSCTSATSLAAGASCTASYDLPLGLDVGTFTFTASGTGAVTNTLDLENSGFLYVSDSSDVYVCDRDSSGELSGCESTGSGFTTPEQLTLNSTGTQLYVANIDANTISVCDTNASTGELSGCIKAATFDDSAYGIALNSDDSKAYVPQALPADSVFLCDVENDGTLSGCASTVTGFLYAEQIALNQAGTRAYVLDYDADNAYVCDVNSETGALSDCGFALEPNPFSQPDDIVLNNASGSEYAFVASGGDDSVYTCPINSGTGAFDSCTQSESSKFVTPGSIDMNASGTQAYVGNKASDTVALCTVSGENKTLSDCQSFTVGTGGYGLAIR